MNCGTTEIRMWANSPGVLTKTLSDAVNALCANEPFFKAFERYALDFRSITKLGNDCFVGKLGFCDRLDAMTEVEEAIKQAAAANNVLIATCFVDQDFINGIETLFDSAVEAAAFTFVEGSIDAYEVAMKAAQA